MKEFQLQININGHKGEINSNTIIVGHFNTPLIPMDRWLSGQKINEALALNDALDQVSLIDIW